MHVELCSEDAQRQQWWDHECDGPCCCICRSPKPRKEPTMPLLLHPQLKRSLPFIFYSFPFILFRCGLCQSICSSVTSGGSHFAPGIMTTFCTHFLQLTVVVAARSNIPVVVALHGRRSHSIEYSCVPILALTKKKAQTVV